MYSTLQSALSQQPVDDRGDTGQWTVMGHSPLVMGHSPLVMGHSPLVMGHSLHGDPKRL